jgi:NAD(P)-dependent dehydrogenase (short-subunit alcohol dehydrogenase family)
MTSCSTKSIAILYGVGPGLGLALARAFAPTHTLALLSRTRANIEPLVDQLKGENSAFRVHAFESDPTEESLKKAVEEIGKVLGGGKVDLGIWNASAVGSVLSL